MLAVWSQVPASPRLVPTSGRPGGDRRILAWGYFALFSRKETTMRWYGWSHGRRQHGGDRFSRDLFIQERAGAAYRLLMLIGLLGSYLDIIAAWRI